MVRICTLLICLLIGGDGKSQSKIYIGAEVAYSADVFKHKDPGGFITDAPVNSALWGVNCRYLLYDYLFLETGVYARAYKLGVGFKNDTYFTSTDRTGVFVPLRAGARMPLFKGAIAISPVAGISLAMTDEVEVYKYEGALAFDGTETLYEVTPQYAAQSFAMVQGGMGIDIRVFKKGLITMNGNYYSGLGRVMIEHIKYRVNGGAEVSATSTSRGNFWSLGLGLRVGL